MILRIGQEAEADIEEIASYISADNPRAGRHWFEDIHRRCRNLAAMPGMGVARFNVRPELRSFAMGNYLILYRQIEGGAEIVRVLHGARQWQDLL